MSTGKKYEVLEVGIFHPEETSTGELFAGQVGYVVCNLKDFEEGALVLRDDLPSFGVTDYRALQHTSVTQ